MAEEGVDLSLIQSVDLSSTDLSKIAGHNLDPPIGDDVDETDFNVINESDAAWSQVSAGFSESISPEALAESFNSFLFTGSGSDPQMSKSLMEKDQQMLSTILTPPPNEEELIRASVLDWAKANKRSLTSSALKALASALMVNSELSICHLEYVLLGWDLRGEHNVIEVKNVMDAHQEDLNSVVATLREFQGSAKGLITGFQEAATKITSATEKLLTQRASTVPPPPQHTALPSSGPNKKVPVGSNTPQLPPSKVTSQGESSFSPSNEKTVKNLLHYLNRKDQDFEQFLKGVDRAAFFDTFLNTIDQLTWERFLVSRNKEGMLTKLGEYYKTYLSRKAEKQPMQPRN